MDAEEGVARLRALGFSEADARTLWSHFDEAERRGKPSHGHARIAWLETQEFDPRVPVAELPALLGVVEVLPQREALVPAEPKRPQPREAFLRLHGAGS